MTISEGKYMELDMGERTTRHKAGFCGLWRLV